MVSVRVLCCILLCVQSFYWIDCGVLRQNADLEFEIETNFGGKSAKSLKKFKVGCDIGSGNYGSVTTATMTTARSTDPAIGVAIKAANNVTSSIVAYHHLKKEVQIYNMLENAPGFVKFFGCGTSNNELLVVLEKFEFILGELCKTFSTKIEFDRKLFTLEFVIVGTKILRSLHAKGIVHRDLKLDNFVLRHNSEGSLDLALIDFGLAHLPGDKPSALRGNHLTYSLSHYPLDSDRIFVAHPKDDLEALLYLSDYFYDMARWDSLRTISQFEAEKRKLPETLKAIYGDGSPAFIAMNNMLSDVRDRTTNNPFDFDKHLPSLEAALKVDDAQRPAKATYKVGTLRMNPA